MGLLIVTGIVTRYANYRDNDRILTILTNEHGLLSASCRGCRRPKSQLLPCAELFVYAEFVLFFNKDKYTVQSATVLESFYPLREDIEKLSSAAYMLSIVNESQTHQQSHPAILELLLYALTYTALGSANPTDMAIAFTVRCLFELGYSPMLTHCSCCEMDLRLGGSLFFSAVAGGAMCAVCAKTNHPHLQVSSISLEAIRRILLLSPINISRVVLPKQVQSELLPILNTYAEHTLEHKIKPLAQF